MTARNLDRGFYVVNAAGRDVEWYAVLADAYRAARRREDGPCTVERHDGAAVAAPSVVTNVSED